MGMNNRNHVFYLTDGLRAVFSVHPTSHKKPCGFPKIQPTFSKGFALPLFTHFATEKGVWTCGKFTHSLSLSNVSLNALE